jgi:hypothetical protein
MLFAKNALNPGLIPIKDDPHLRTQHQLDYKAAHPTILAPIEPGYKPTYDSNGYAPNPFTNPAVKPRIF